MAAAYAQDSASRLRIFYKDAKGVRGHTDFHVASEASDENKQALVAALQAATDLDIDKYEVTDVWDISGEPAASARGTGHQFASSKAAMRMLFLTAPSKSSTRATLFGPKEAVVTGDGIDNYVLDTTNVLITAIQTAAIAVATNEGGDAVTLLKSGAMLIKKRKK